MEEDSYSGREPARVKHAVLEGYLSALAYKLGGASKRGITLNYVDGFSGPWRHASEDLSDTSPAIAMRVLASVRRTLGERGVPMRARCLFIEKDPAAHAELQQLLAKCPDLEPRALLGRFEDSIPLIETFVREGDDPFGFVFIDPTGWTGFPLSRLKPIFGKRSELLVNLMTKDISRFLVEPSVAESYRGLFGGDEWKQCIGLEGQDRDDCLATTYCRAVERELGFEVCAHAIVLHPEFERTHYHLAYATNNLVGLDVFRSVERRAMEVQGAARGSAQLRREQGRDPGQGLLLPASDWRSTSVNELAARFQPRARKAIEDLLVASTSVPYDQIVVTALRFPLTTKAMVNGWLTTWKSAGRITFEGLPAKKRVPELGAGQCVAVSRSK